MATKLARMVIYLDRLLIIKSYKALILWSCKVTWQTKSIISLLQECLWQPNLTDSFPWWALIYNVAWPFDHIALWDMRFTYRTRFSTQTLKSSPNSWWYSYILTSSYLQLHIPLLTVMHPYILRFMCACLYSCILTSSYPQAHVCLLVYLHPHILISPVYVHLLVSSHPHILVCSHLQVNVFLIQMNNCILASSSSLVFGSCASRFVNNLQILQTGKAFVLDFYHTRRKIYW